MSDEGVARAGVVRSEGPLAFRAGKAIWAAGVAVAVGVAVGVLMMVQRPQAECGAGPAEGAVELRCLAAPQVLAGAGVVAAFVALAALVHLAWVVVVALDERPPGDRPTQP